MILLAAVIVYPLYLFCLAGLLILLAPFYVVTWIADEIDFRRNW